LAFDLAYHPEVEADLRRLPRNLQRRVLAAIANRLAAAPEKYGRPLSGPLSRYRKLRVGDVRVVFDLLGSQVVVYAALDRKVVYQEVARRLPARPARPARPSR
jgi:mRNA interferase RelE/StbE